MIKLMLFLSLFTKEPDHSPWVRLLGRSGQETFMAKLDPSLTLHREDPAVFANDSRQPSCTFSKGSLTITFHPFLRFGAPPIPAEMQVKRWMDQLKEKDPLNLEIEPISSSGYTGLLLFAKDGDQAVLAASLVLSKEAEVSLRRAYRDHEVQDFTVKAKGSFKDLTKEREKIEALIMSIQHIHSLKNPYDSLSR